MHGTPVSRVPGCRPSAHCKRKLSKSARPFIMEEQISRMIHASCAAVSPCQAKNWMHVAWHIVLFSHTVLPVLCEICMWAIYLGLLCIVHIPIYVYLMAEFCSNKSSKIYLFSALLLAAISSAYCSSCLLYTVGQGLKQQGADCSAVSRVDCQSQFVPSSFRSFLTMGLLCFHLFKNIFMPRDS